MMRSILIGLLCAAAPLLAQDTGFVSMFNGKDLAGWEIDTPGIWSAHDGMIVGHTTDLKHNDFLRAKTQYKDFIMKASFRLVGGEGNSGIQIRSVIVPDSHEVAGYQADIGQVYTGSLYDEARRKKTLVLPPKEKLAGLNLDAWNELVIVAKGNHITIDLNGVRTVDYQETEPGMDNSGLIALQVHAGHPMEVQFKNLQIKAL